MDQISKKLLDVSLALSNEKDDEALLELILTEAMDIACCDGGTLYIKQDNQLFFRVMITRSLGGLMDSVTLPPVDLADGNLCAMSLMQKRIINISNVAEHDSIEFAGPKKYDAMTGYKTVSMLVIPMMDKENHQIGVLQLINALDINNNIVSFSNDHEIYISALTSLAATSLVKMNQANEINGLLDSLVRSLSTAIYQRTPYNVNHTQNMVRYANKFLMWLRNNCSEYALSEDDEKQFIMSVWLHDVGKLTVPLEVMNKSTRLGNDHEKILTRFKIIELTAKINELTTGEPSEPIIENLTFAKDIIAQANTAELISENLIENIKKIAMLTYIDSEGCLVNWLTEKETNSLCVFAGTLTAQEREVMQGHVVMTEKILGQVSFGSKYNMVSKWASEHHEFVNGTGYPNGLKNKELCKESRMLTILDVFDGLSAKDRPYKPQMPIEKVLGIMGLMVDEGKLDPIIFDIFKQSKVWEGIL